MVAIVRKKESKPFSTFGTVAYTMTRGLVPVFLTECQAPGGMYQTDDTCWSLRRPWGRTFPPDDPNDTTWSLPATAGSGIRVGR